MRMAGAFWPALGVDGRDARHSNTYNPSAFFSYIMFPYIMPTGGAGSLGSPALDSGILIINAARPAITISPTK